MTTKTANKVTKSTAAPKGAAKGKVKAKPKAAKAPAVNVHTEAGMSTAKYAGPSSFVNANRKPKIKVLDTVRPVGKMTDRLNAALYALRETHGGKSFKPRGFDNGCLRDLQASGLITHTGGVTETIDGAAYIVDGATAVSFKLTTAGMKYGKA